MRASLAYFAGAGTVVVAIAAGLGGGLVIADVMNPNATKVLSKVEHQTAAKQQAAQQSPQPDAAQASPQPSPAPNAPRGPAPYLDQVQPAAKTPVVVGAAAQKPQEKAQEKPEGKSEEKSQERSREQPKSEAAANPPAARASDAPAKHDVAAAKPDDSPKAKRDDAPKSKQAEQASQPAPHDDASAPDNAYAKARDADLKHSDDKRKPDRRQWASRHQPQRDRDQEMRDVEDEVRRDSGPREVYVERDDSDGPGLFGSDRPRRAFDRPRYRDDSDRPRNFGGPIDFPRMNLFGPD